MNDRHENPMLSRVADNLYWMSRYLERAEHTARLIDVDLQLRLDQSPAAGSDRWLGLLEALQVPAPENVPLDAEILTHLLTSRSRQSIVNDFLRRRRPRKSSPGA